MKNIFAITYGFKCINELERNGVIITPETSIVRNRYKSYSPKEVENESYHPGFYLLTGENNNRFGGHELEVKVREFENAGSIKDFTQLKNHEDVELFLKKLNDLPFEFDGSKFDIDFLIKATPIIMSAGMMVTILNKGQIKPEIIAKESLDCAEILLKEIKKKIDTEK